MFVCAVTYLLGEPSKVTKWYSNQIQVQRYVLEYAVRIKQLVVHQTALNIFVVIASRFLSLVKWIPENISLYILTCPLMSYKLRAKYFPYLQKFLPF